MLSPSRSAGVFYVPEFRGTDLEQQLAGIRAQLPELRDALRLDRLPEFAREAAEDQRLPDVVPEEVAQLQYTSGTTGFPKGALLHHRGITNNARLLSERLGVQDGWVWLNQMPLFHTGGCVLSTLGPLQFRATQVLAPWFDPGLTLDLIETEGVNVTGGVPTMFLGLISHPDFPAPTCRPCRWCPPVAHWSPLTWCAASRRGSACGTRPCSGRPRRRRESP